MAQVKKRTLDIYDGYYVEQVIDSYTYLAKMGLGQPQLAYIDSVNKVN